MTKNKNLKRILAKQMMTQQELRSNLPPFDSKAWIERKEAIKKKTKKIK